MVLHPLLLMKLLIGDAQLCFVTVCIGRGFWHRLGINSYTLKYFIHTEFICYDDGCHLRKYAHNSTRKVLTETTKCLAEIEIVVDKMHVSGHTDKWCKTYCDPNKFTKLENVRNNNR